MMKKYTFTAALVFSITAFFAQTPCESGFADQWPCEAVDLWSYMPLGDMGGGANTNDIWGWTDELSGREFALVGKNTGTAFVEITDPANIIYLGSLETHTTPSLWRDIKVYNNHAFIVSEAGDHGMQIFDLTELLTITNPPATLSETAYYGEFGSAHNIVINEETGFAYGVGAGTFNGGLHIVDIANPTNPSTAGGFENDGYTHDAQAVIYTGPDTDYSGKEIVFACNEDNIAIVDVSDKSDCQLIANGSYDGDQYTHQGWLTEDQRYFLLGDELDEMNTGINTRTVIFDVTDLDNPVYFGDYSADNTAIDHNMYVMDNLIYQSNYRSGLRVVDAANIDNVDLYEIASFDVSPSDDNASFSGSWSNYPYFPSGNIVVTDMNDGFFVLKPNFYTAIPEGPVSCADEVDMEINVNAHIQGTFSIGIQGLAGTSITGDSFTILETGSATISGLGTLDAGTYNFEIVLTTEFGSYYVPTTIEVLDAVLDEPSLLMPANNSQTFDNMLVFSWEDQSADVYTIEVASEMDFTNIVYEENVFVPEMTMPFGLLEGEYFWRVNATSDCGESDFSDIFTFEVLIEGIDENETYSFSISPNPASSDLWISSEDMINEVSLIDVSGRVISSFNAKGVLNYKVNVSSFEAGVYFIAINGQSLTKRIVIE